MTILSKKKQNTTKDRRGENSNGSEVDVHGVQNEHGATGSIALPNSPYQVFPNCLFIIKTQKSKFSDTPFSLIKEYKFFIFFF
jgi:hypothetical protein